MGYGKNSGICCLEKPVTVENCRDGNLTYVHGGMNAYYECPRSNGEISFENPGRNSSVEGTIYLRGRPICDDGFGMNEAKVACKMAGYSSGVHYR